MQNSFEIRIFLSSGTKIKALVITQWNNFENLMIFEQVTFTWKETVDIGTQCTYACVNYFKVMQKTLDKNISKTTKFTEKKCQVNIRRVTFSWNWRAFSPHLQWEKKRANFKIGMILLNGVVLILCLR